MCKVSSPGGRSVRSPYPLEGSGDEVRGRKSQT